MKKILLFLLISMLLLCAFTACKKENKKQNNNFVGNTDVSENNNNGNNDINTPTPSGPNENSPTTDDSNNSCEHTYSDTWSSNSNEHWHKATCEHTGLKTDIGSHTDTDENGICDTCEYQVGHSHTYALEWTHDVTHHWRVATCSHKEEKGNLGAHIDANSDGACDFCVIHMHVVSAYGRCTVCGEKIFDVNLTGIADVIDLAVSNAARVTGGRVEYENICTEIRLDSQTPDPEDIMRILSSQEREILYTLGKNAAYYKIVSKATYDKTVRSSTQENWYEQTAEDSVFGVYSTDFGHLMPTSASPLDLVGYNFVVSTLANARGPENLLYTLYRLSQTTCSSSYICDYNDGLYSFSFDYLQINDNSGGDVRADYYELEVSFRISNAGVLTQLDVICDCYSNSFYYEDEIENDLNNDYLFDQSTHEITMKDTAIPDTYTFSITQNEGVRTYVSEHPRSEFIPEDFTLYLDSELSEPASTDINVTVGKGIRLYLGNFTPTGTSATYLGNNFAAFCDSDNVICSVNPISASVFIFTKQTGCYTIRIVAGDIIKEITVIAKSNAPVTEEQPPENSIKVYITDNNAWVDLAVFTAYVDGDYTFTIAPGVYLGAMEVAGVPWADFNGVDESGVPRGGSVTVSLKAGETYKFYVMSPEKNINVYIPYAISDYTGNFP